MTSEHPEQVPKFIRRLMPHANEQELFEATDNFKRYMAVVRRIYERISQEMPELDSSERRRFDRMQNDDHDV